MAVDLTETLNWARIALRSDDEILSNETLQRIAASSVDRLVNIYPQILIEGGANLTNLTPADFERFSEAAGYLVAARWIILPKPDGEETVVRLKIGQLEEVYQAADLKALLAFYREECANAIRRISFIAESRVLAHLSGKGIPKIVIANPTRHKAAQSPNAAYALAMLFSDRQDSLVGDDFDGASYGGNEYG